LTKAAKKKAAAAAKAAADAASEAAAAAAKAAAGKPGKAGGKGGGKGGKEGKGGDPNSKKKILCKFIKDPSKGTCNRGKECPFSHNKRLFDSEFKFVGRKRGKGDKGGGQGGAGGNGDDWNTPIGLSGCGPQVVITKGLSDTAATPRAARTAGRECGEGPCSCGQIQAVVISGDVGKQQVQKDKTLKRLNDLPKKCWTEVPEDRSGIQFFTRGRVGLTTHDFMLDGGSGVNSTTEELVLKVLNENQAAGISLDDKRHPIKQFERWAHEEALRGVAGGKNVPLLGAVIVAVHLIELGKNDGPEVLVRFKVCGAGSTDWVGWILGGRCIDCPANGGLGFIPLEHSHSFTALGIQTERSERPGGPKPDRCYAAKLSSFDSDDEEA
jgi:hypothetical protein